MSESTAGQELFLSYLYCQFTLIVFCKERKLEKAGGFISLVAHKESAILASGSSGNEYHGTPESYGFGWCQQSAVTFMEV